MIDYFNFLMVLYAFINNNSIQMILIGFSGVLTQKAITYYIDFYLDDENTALI